MSECTLTFPVCRASGPCHGSPPQREEALRGHAMVVQPCMQSIDDGLQPAPQVPIRGRIHLMAKWWVVRGVSVGQLKRVAEGGEGS